MAIGQLLDNYWTVVRVVSDRHRMQVGWMVNDHGTSNDWSLSESVIEQAAKENEPSELLDSTINGQRC